MKNMKKYPYQKIKGLLISTVCGVLSFVVNFVIMSQTVALPDPLWVALMLLIPVFIAICLIRRSMEVHPGYIWVGLPAQYLLFFIFSRQISVELGINLDKGTSGFEYVFIATIWPFVVTLTQFLSLMVLNWKRKSR